MNKLVIEHIGEMFCYPIWSLPIPKKCKYCRG